jgi:hypothetical protein
MKLEQRIQRDKSRLNAVVATMSLGDKYVIRLSQRLDNLIVKKMRRDLA